MLCNIIDNSVTLLAPTFLQYAREREQAGLQSSSLPPPPSSLRQTKPVSYAFIHLSKEAKRQIPGV
ncbi:MAG: hypothetical protein M3146_06965 [Thermoproteota archaeon]|nr:hypothetical protein [Thermoproteota archaeon]